jgi:uncharacterized protein YjbJ (UPF0337 family)
MNDDIFTGQWKQMRGALRSWWAKISDDDFERIGGQKDELIGVIQEKYGYTRDQAESEVERRFKEYGAGSGSRLSASGAAETIKDKAYDLSATAASKAREVTAGVTSGLEKAGSYFKEERVENIAADLIALVRRYPVQSALIGIGLVYLLFGSRSSESKQPKRTGAGTADE